MKRGGSETPSDPGEFAAAVGEGIRVARQVHGWTQAQLAEGAGLSVNYVSRLERGEVGPSLFVASRIADTLGLSIEALIAGGGPPRRTSRRRLDKE